MGWDLPGSGKKLAPHLRAAPEHGGVGFEAVLGCVGGQPRVLRWKGV